MAAKVTLPENTDRKPRPDDFFLSGVPLRALRALRGGTFRARYSLGPSAALTARLGPPPPTGAGALRAPHAVLDKIQIAYI